MPKTPSKPTHMRTSSKVDSLTKSRRTDRSNSQRDSLLINSSIDAQIASIVSTPRSAMKQEPPADPSQIVLQTPRSLRKASIDALSPLRRASIANELVTDPELALSNKKAENDTLSLPSDTKMQDVRLSPVPDDASKNAPAEGNIEDAKTPEFGSFKSKYSNTAVKPVFTSPSSKNGSDPAHRENSAIRPSVMGSGNAKLRLSLNNEKNNEESPSIVTNYQYSLFSSYILLRSPRESPKSATAEDINSTLERLAQNKPKILAGYLRRIKLTFKIASAPTLYYYNLKDDKLSYYRDETSLEFAVGAIRIDSV